MEKSIGYPPPSEQNIIKKEPEPLIKRVKSIVSNISHRLQKPERTIAPQDNKNTTPLPKGIIELAEKRAGKEEVKGFGDFLASKLSEPIDRRTALKIGLGTAVGLISADYAIKNIDSLWTEYQEKKVDEAIKESKELQSSINLLNKVAEYPEMIDKSGKQSLNEFAKDLAKKDFDNLILGVYHEIDPTPSTQKSVQLLEELIKNGKKISAICLEGISYLDPEHIETIKKLNQGETSPEEITKIRGIVNNYTELVKFARNNSIEIVGLEKEPFEKIKKENKWERFKEISKRVEDVTKERKNDGIVVTFIGQQHATTDTWENKISIGELAGKKDYLYAGGISIDETLENDYTIKEYLEKINLKPIAISIENWKLFADATDGAFAARLEKLSPEDQKIFYEKAKNKWQSYRLKEKEDFVVPCPKAKENTYSMIIPSEIPEKPPKLAEKMGDN